MGIRALIRALAVGLGVLTAAGCANPCERELRVTEQRCGHELAPGYNTGEQECRASDLKEARCALDHKDDYCEWLDAIADGEVVENDYVRCLLE